MNTSLYLKLLYSYRKLLALLDWFFFVLEKTQDFNRQKWNMVFQGLS